jgi:cytochrome P450
MDPSVFQDPEVVNSSRFLSPLKRQETWNDRVDDMLTTPFSFGRRECPGMHVSCASWVSTLALSLIAETPTSGQVSR